MLRSPNMLSNKRQAQVGQGGQRACGLPMCRDSSVEEKPEGKGSTGGWVEEAPFTEADSASPTSWPGQDANLSPEKLLVQIKVSEKGLECEPATSAQGRRASQPGKELQSRARQAL